jgi:hypothetical protein
MKKYELWMNPLKCAFRVTSRKILGFVVHERGIQIDPKKIESIGKIREPVCKNDIQKLLGKINYLWRFISNLAGWVKSLLPLLRLKHEEQFTWGPEQREALKKIKEYLVSPPVLQAPRPGTRSRCTLPHKNGLSELFHYKEKMARSFQ